MTFSTLPEPCVTRLNTNKALHEDRIINEDEVRDGGLRQENEDNTKSGNFKVREIERATFVYPAGGQGTVFCTRRSAD